jgi:hypothetical protein
LKVNNHDITQATHTEAVQALLQATSEVVLLVRHEPQPAGLKVYWQKKHFLKKNWNFLQELMLSKHSSEPLGIRINGGVDGKRVNPDDQDDDGIFVTEVCYEIWFLLFN